MNTQKALEYVRQSHGALSKICEPLMNFFPVNAFAYAEYCNEDQYIHLSTNADWTQIHLSYDQNGALLEGWARESLRKKGQFLTEFWSNSFLDDAIMKRGADEYQYYHGVNIYKSTGNSVKLWAFATNSADGFLFLQTHQDLLEHFITYFEEASTDFITDSARKEASAKWRVPMNLNISQLTEEEKACGQFLKAIALKKRTLRFNDQAFKITEKQWDYLRLYSTGNSMKEIARVFDISPRTIENVLQNLSFKTGLRGKSELMKLYQANQF